MAPIVKAVRARSFAQGMQRALSALHVVVFLVSTFLLAANCVNAGSQFDIRDIEPHAFDFNWIFQYPWRADHGEWSGRDFFYPRGPLWQLVSWTGSGFAFRSISWTIAGNRFAFGFLSLLACLWLSHRTVHRPVLRAALATTLAALALFLVEDSFRTLFITLLPLHLYSGWHPTGAKQKTRGEEFQSANNRDAAIAGAITTIAFLFAYERGVIALVAIGSMATFGTVMALVERDSIRPQWARARSFVAGFVATQLAASIFFWAWHGDYFEYLLEMHRIASAYTIAMRSEGTRGAVFFLMGFIAVVLVMMTVGRRRDRAAVMLLVGSLPSAIPGLVRSDPVHIVMGTGVLTGALLLVSFRHIAAQRRLTATATGGLAACMFGYWVVTYPVGALEWIDVPAGLVSRFEGETSRHGRYDSDLPRALTWLRERVREEDPPCVGTSEWLGSLHALAGVTGPMQLRWTSGMQHRMAHTVDQRRCPYWLHSMFTFDNGELFGSWIFGPDLLALARNYRPIEQLGPAVIAMERRPRPAPELERPIVIDGAGEWRTLSVPGAIDLPFGREVPESHLVAIAYEMEFPDAARLVGGVPQVQLMYLGRGEQVGPAIYALLGDLNQEVEQVVPIDPWTAEWRWINGLEPLEERSVDTLRFELQPVSMLTPKTVRLRVRAVTEIIPGSPPREPSSNVEAPANLLTELRMGRAWPRYVSVENEPDYIVRPHPEIPCSSSLFFPIHVTAGTGLAGELVFGGEEGELDVEILIMDPLELVTRRMHIQSLTLGADQGRTARLDIPLDPWADRDAYLWIQLCPRGGQPEPPLYIRRLELTKTAPMRSLVAAIQTGIARIGDNDVVAERTDLHIHPVEFARQAAEVRIPVRPSDSMCFRTDLRHAGTEGDGLFMEAGMEEHGRTIVLFRQFVGPGEEMALPPFSLSYWAEREVELVLRTRPGRTPDFDWGWFVSPRLDAPCTDGHPPPTLPEESGYLIGAFGADRVRTLAGEPVVRGEELFLHPLLPNDDPPASVAFDVTPPPGACLYMTLRHGGDQGDGVLFSGLVQDASDAAPTSIFRAHLRPGELRRLEPIPLERWAERDVELILETLPGSSPDYDWAYFQSPAIGPCPSP